jgi:signal transduction histidine kinase
MSTTRFPPSYQLQTPLDDTPALRRNEGVDLSEMSHMLKTPLNAILGHTEMRLEECVVAGQDSYVADLRRIHSAAEQLHVLFDRLLDRASSRPTPPEAGRG